MDRVYQSTVVVMPNQFSEPTNQFFDTTKCRESIDLGFDPLPEKSPRIAIGGIQRQMEQMNFLVSLKYFLTFFDR
jgi:hypothetical protein